MKTQTLLIAGAIAALSACTSGSSDGIDRTGVRTTPQSESPSANSPGGKVPEGGATTGATPVVIVDDSAAPTANGSIFEFQG